MMSSRIFAGAAVLVLLVAACGSSPTLSEGKIVHKEYDDADEWYQAGYTIDGGSTCTGGYNGQPQTCYDNADIHIPGQWHHEDERYLLELEGPHPDKEGETITDTREVPEWFFDKVREGQWVDVEALEIIPR